MHQRIQNRSKKRKGSLKNVDNLIHGKNVIRHSHVTGEIVGYAHSFCNLKVRENKSQISVVAHDLCGFDFFLFLKGLIVAWKSTNLSICRKKLTSVNCANISVQVMFIETVKYFQQSLSGLPSSMNDEEEKGVRTGCERFIKKGPKLNEKFLARHETDREWILDYLSLGKGVIPYKMIQRPDSLDISPERGNFFLPHHFYSRLKDSIISDKVKE